MIPRKTFGSTGLDVPVLGQGTWQMERDDRRGAIDALRAGLEFGMTHIDTAELYGRGEVEDLVAEAIEGRRDEVYLVSKVMPSKRLAQGRGQSLRTELETPAHRSPRLLPRRTFSPAGARRPWPHGPGDRRTGAGPVRRHRHPAADL